MKARHNRKYPEINIGDKVKVYKQRGALEKEWMGDYKPDTTTVTEITKSLGQTFYKVIGEGKSFIRSEILLVSKKLEDEVAAREPIPEPIPVQQTRADYQARQQSSPKGEHAETHG